MRLSWEWTRASAQQPKPNNVLAEIDAKSDGEAGRWGSRGKVYPVDMGHARED